MSIDYIGIDLGGTNLRLCRMNSDGIIEKIIKVDTEVEKGLEQLIEKIVFNINILKTNFTKKVGLSVPGQVDVHNGIILNTTNLPFNNLDIGKIIKARCNLDVVLNNDANVAGLAEAVAGSAKDYNSMYYITWSTGIGGALVLNKQLFNGKHMYCGEIGNIVVDKSTSYTHKDMTHGSVESICSGTALARYASELNYKNVQELFNDYKNKNDKIVALIDDVCDKIAQLIATIYHVVEVDIFVIGGGVILKSGDILLEVVKNKLNDYLLSTVHDKIKLKTTFFNDDAGLYGSCFLIKQ